MRVRLVLCVWAAMLLSLPVQAGKIAAQLWGNFTYNWAEMLRDVAVMERRSGSELPLVPEYPKVRLAVWSHTGKGPQTRFSAEQVSRIRSYVSQGGVLVLFDCVPLMTFPGIRHDLSASKAVLGASAFCYNTPKASVTELGRKALGNTLAKGDIYSGSSRIHGSLQRLCGMKTLIGSRDRVDLGVHRLGLGAVIYYAGGYQWGFPCAPDAPFAVMMKRLVMTALDSAQLDTFFPRDMGNGAVTVKGKRMHVALYDGPDCGYPCSVLRDKLRAVTGTYDFSPRSSAEQFSIHVGQTPYVKSLGLDFKTLHPFGYYIVCRDGRNLVLAGKNQKTTRYAVNDFLKKFAGYRKFGAGSLMEVLPKAKTILLPETLELREEPSIDSYVFSMFAFDDFGRSYRLNSMATHSMDKLVPIKLYAKTHPEYFPFNHGRRRNMLDKNLGPWNPCMSNPDLPKLVERYADAYFKKNPDALSLPLGVNDGGGDCQCPECQAKMAKYGNMYAEFYNMAARVVAKRHPGKLVAFIAYSKFGGSVPRGLQMEPNILVECIGSVINGSNRFEEWKKAGVRNFGLYNYHYAINAGMVTPQYYPHVIGLHWKELHKKYHLRSMWHEYRPSVDVMSAGRQYVLNELAWNMDADIDALLKDFFTSLFENIAPEMQSFFDRFEMVFARQKNALHPIDYWYSHRQMDPYAWADLERMDSLLAEAGKKSVSPLVRHRYEVVKRIYEMCRLHIANHLLARDIREYPVYSMDRCVKLLALVRKGYENLDHLLNLHYTEEEQKEMFVNKDRVHTFYFSNLMPRPYLEAAVDKALDKVVACLRTNKVSPKKFFAQEMSKGVLPDYQVMLGTRIYLEDHQPANLIKNPSFELVKGAEKTSKSLMSDHIPLENLPPWRSWTYPNAYTHFGVTDKLSHSGKKCAFIGENQIRGMLLYYAWLDKPHARYRLGCWVRRNYDDKTNNRCGVMGVRFIGKKGWLDHDSSIRVDFTRDCTDNWVYYETTFTSPDEPAVGLIQIEPPGQERDQFLYVDDFSLERIYVPEEKDGQGRQAKIRILAPWNQSLVQLDTAVETARHCIARAGSVLPELTVRLVLEDRGADGAFDVSGKGRDVTITGSEEGLRCGLYTLLNALGIHWFSPAEDMVFPTSPVTFDPASLNGHHAPDFSYRGLHIIAARNQYEDRLGRWMSFNRMNRKLTHLPQVPIIGGELKKMGLKPDTTVHAYSEFIKEKTYFKTHPEYFALIGGKRMPYSKGGQLCLSNQNMRRDFTRELLAVLKAHPELGVIGICPEDGYGHCECPACKALNTPEDNQTGTVNGRIADFVKDICARIEKAAPERMLGHYSYSNFANFMELLPQSPKNLMMSFTVTHCHRHGLNDPACPENVASEKRLEHLCSKIRHIYVYDYYGYRWEKMPAPYLPAQERDFRHWKKLGVDGFMTEVSDSTSTFWEGLWPAVYYASRLLWKADYSYEDAIRDLCRARYGKAAKPMTDYFLALQESGQKMPGCFKREAHNFAEILTSQMRATCRRAMDSALKLEPNNQLVKKEAALFDYWCRNLELRRRYSTPREIVTRSLAAPGFKPQQIYLVDWSSQLPDLKNNTEVEVAADDTRIRFRFKMHETLMHKIRCEGHQVLSADCIELFLNDGLDPKKCYHFMAAADARYVASECKGTSWNWNWKHHATVKAERHKDHWTLEIALPKSDIHAGKEFTFSVARNRHAERPWQMTGTPEGGAFFKTEKYIRAK